MMKRVKLYQTLEDRGNPEEIEEQGPFDCIRDDRWLACGAYFWEDDLTQAAKWGGKYQNGYVICESEYDSDNKNYFDLTTMEHYESIKKCQVMLEKKSNGDEATLQRILDFLISENRFPYKAIRYAFVMEDKKPIIVSGKYHAILSPPIRSMQVCVLERDFLIDGRFKIIYPPEYAM